MSRDKKEPLYDVLQTLETEGKTNKGLNMVVRTEESIEGYK